MGLLVLQIDTDDLTLTDLANRYTRADRRQSMSRLHELVGSIGPGHRRAVVTTYVSGAQASGTIGCDFSDAVDGTDDVTIGPTTLSVEASPSGEDEFDSGTDDIEFAANLVAAIAAHSVLSKSYTAVSDGVDTVTVTHRLAGISGNETALAETGNGFTLGAAALAGGTQNATQEFDFGQT